MARIIQAAALAAAVLMPLSAGVAAAQQGGGGDAPPPAVTVVTLQPQDLTLTTVLPGRVRASSEAEVLPQVSGIITERLFTEGSQVSEGDVLYRIDPTTYEAAVAQAQASVSQAQAQQRAAERDFERVSQLSDRGVSSQQAADDAASARDSANAAVEVAQAQLRSAEIELDRTEIRARLSGRIGLSNVSPGALVTASQATPLATIRELDPVYVDVTQSAAELLAWRRGDTAADLGEGNREVALTLADGSIFEERGLVTAAEPHVDEQTGVVVLRIEFDNPEGLLLPGMYVQVEMPTTQAEGVYLAPQEGVTRDRRGNPLAMVVSDEGVVESRQLTVLQDRGSDWIVSDGLEPGDRIVVAGMSAAQPGAQVTPEERAPEGAENAQPGNGQAQGAQAQGAQVQGATTEGAEGTQPAPATDAAPGTAETEATETEGPAAGQDAPAGAAQAAEGTAPDAQATEAAAETAAGEED
ncbi:efflux RND transporter periplasmic adaptor subunit [Mesobaculum littorinae]|uniref:Efflux RND transporter periplasmic adaptor subunit n=1 Tax=Mesobaculum littorinae TaxID=2486419 RepID=A0A438AMN7_9RHOB|nr:efflux RND transporter periplasmic adaptor subunit [Mesobaculum littorinae]RVV99952.1 efflux RND transporter periplasmic adaptor subunit [Mesobaculum littorinae]